MELVELTAISPLDGRYAQKTKALRDLCSEYGLIKFRFIVEVKWLQALAAQTTIKEISPFNEEANQYLNDLMEKFDLDDAKNVKEIERTTNHDVKAIEYYLKSLLEKNPLFTPYLPFIHFACTSEDINNISYALMLKTLRDEHVLPLMDNLIKQLQTMAHDYAHLAMLARTHGQVATPTTLGKEIANFVYRLREQRDRFAHLPICAKINGAVGNFNAHAVSYPSIDWPAVCTSFLNELGLHYHPYTTQIEPHDFIADYCFILSHFNLILIDLSRDVWGYIALGYFTQKSLAHEVGSSTMPHKINPIDFENAEGNLGVANALLQHFANKLPISRWQRDLSDSTVLRNMGMGVGYALLACQSLQTGLKKLNVNEALLQKELEDHLEVLAEPIQTIMRQYGLHDAYEQLKTLTRGQPITQLILRNFILGLSLPDEVKHNLLELTPKNYIGLAEKLAKNI